MQSQEVGSLQLLAAIIKTHPDWGFWAVIIGDEPPLKVGRIQETRGESGTEAIPTSGTLTSRDWLTAVPLSRLFLL